MPACAQPPPLRVSVYFQARPWGPEPCAPRRPPRAQGPGAQVTRAYLLQLSRGSRPLDTAERAHTRTCPPSPRRCPRAALPAQPRCRGSPSPAAPGSRPGSSRPQPQASETQPPPSFLPVSPLPGGARRPPGCPVPLPHPLPGTRSCPLLPKARRAPPSAPPRLSPVAAGLPPRSPRPLFRRRRQVHSLHR